jgi:alkylhydroperoxidase family enzyme
MHAAPAPHDPDCGDDTERKFLAAGYTRRNVLEVILGVATKVMSNYTNHIAHTQLDKFMRGNEWLKPVA